MISRSGLADSGSSSPETVSWAMMVTGWSHSLRSCQTTPGACPHCRAIFSSDWDTSSCRWTRRAVRLFLARPMAAISAITMVFPAPVGAATISEGSLRSSRWASPMIRAW